MRRHAAMLLTLAVAAAAFADGISDGLPDGRGVAAPSGSVLTTEISPALDADDYVLRGFRGTTLTASVRVPRGGRLVPLVEIVRPGGSVVTADDGLVLSGKANSPTAKFVLDATGTWKVRVRGSEDSVGAYSVSVKTSRPARAVETIAAPDQNGQYRFAVPATGGARVSWTLKWSGAAPTFNSFHDPLGRPVDGAPPDTTAKRFELPAVTPLGDCTLTFDAAPGGGPVTLSRTLDAPKEGKPRNARMSRAEPSILTNGVTPASGGALASITVATTGLVDPLARRGAAGLFLDDVPLDEVVLAADGSTISGRVPARVGVGVHDVVVTTTSGQPAVRAGGFELVEAPVVESFEPTVGSALGGFEITLKGQNFRSAIGLLIDGELQPVSPTFVDSTTVRFVAPPHAADRVVLGVRDLASSVDGHADDLEFEYVTTPVIARVNPSLVPILGGETVTLEGFLFSATDRVFFETTTPGVYEEISASQTTYVNSVQHRFVAPIRPKGDYRVYVEDVVGRPNPPQPKTITSYSFADVTAASGLGSLAGEACDAATSALADVDRDGDLDLVLARRGGATASAASETRILRNDGHGAFSNATADVMPAVGADDWRADRVAAADIDGDGFPDLVLTTNSLTVPPAGRSHTRILMNEARGGTGANATDRVLRDRTVDVMAPVRKMKKYGYFTAGGGEEYVSDDWRGLDVWVGDLDRSGSGPPEMVLTHLETKDDDNPQPDIFSGGVYCGNYCASPYASIYSYAFYWGGSRKFTWDAKARGGLGRYKFDPNFFPRRAGALYASTTLPSGIAPLSCNARYNGATCKGMFTPFTGKRVAVGDLDDDGKLDVAVVSTGTVERRFTQSGPLSTISSLQVGLQGFDKTNGAGVFDVTAKLTALGLDLRGDAVAIGATGFPDGNGFGSIAVTRSQTAAGSALTLLRFSVSGSVTSVEDVTAATLPAPLGADSLQASLVRFEDADGDGDLDLVLLGSTAPGGTQTALRVLRNETVNGQSGVFRRTLGPLFAQAEPPGDHLDGDALAIGDVTGDGLLEFVISRAVPAAPDSQTRIVSTTR